MAVVVGIEWWWSGGGKGGGSQVAVVGEWQ
jgi:hypothetical protein